MPAPGCYDLTGEEARRGGEWLTGIARVMQARFSETTLPLVTPYLDIVRAFNPQRELDGLSRIAADRARAAAAAGSPDGLRDRTERAQATDRRAAPRHPGARGRSRRLAGVAGLRAAEGAARPGADRSALRAKGRVRTAGRRLCARPIAKWPTGSYLLWYPVKSRRATDTLARHVAEAVGAEQAGRESACAWSSASRRRPPAAALTSAGLLIVNPPWTLLRRVEGDPSRTGKAARPGRRRPVQARDAQALSQPQAVGQAGLASRMPGKVRFGP